MPVPVAYGPKARLACLSGCRTASTFRLRSLEARNQGCPDCVIGLDPNIINELGDFSWSFETETGYTLKQYLGRLSEPAKSFSS
jgi:hypothetical protein